jgi:hypothetical protein
MLLSPRLQLNSEQTIRSCGVSAEDSSCLTSMNGRHNMSEMNLQQMVHEALDNSLENGYHPSDSDDVTIADQLIDFTDAFELFRSDEIIPHIESWKEQHDDD